MERKGAFRKRSEHRAGCHCLCKLLSSMGDENDEADGSSICLMKSFKRRRI